MLIPMPFRINLDILIPEVLIESEKFSKSADSAPKIPNIIKDIFAALFRQ